MKKVFFCSFFIFLIISCTTTKQLTPTEMKAISTKQFDANYDMVFRSAVSLLQSEGFLIERTDKETGLINASKRIDNKKFGYQENASTSKIVFYVEAINKELTEVKLTIYEGSIQKKSGSYGHQQSSNTESVVQDAAIYQAWFYNLRTEIERRKATY